MNPWEACALQYNFSNDPETETRVNAWGSTSEAADPIIYPGLYAPSGFDMMNILIRVASRPHPVIDLGPIDSSCAVILCDLEQKDCPIVYASDSFYLLTGYSSKEVVGHNCRFLQAPGGKVRKGTTRQYVDKEVLRQMKRSVEKNAEVQVEVVNFKKNGARFTNLLTIIPVQWDGPGYRYAVGLQCDKDE